MSFVQQQGTVPPPSALGISGTLPGQQAVNTTRVLSLTGFSKELKTRDIQSIFVDYEEDRGGYRIKWLDDTGCLIVFSDPLTAKKAFLHLLANPHPLLQAANNPETSAPARLEPYLGPDVDQVIGSVASRPRSRSIASGNATHARRMSNTSQATGHNRTASNAGANATENGAGVRRSGSRTFGRASLGQGQMQAIIDEANKQGNMPSGHLSGSAIANDPVSPTEGPSPSGGAIDWSLHQQRERTTSGSIGSPERTMGATSPSRMRRMPMQRP